MKRTGILIATIVMACSLVLLPSTTTAQVPPATQIVLPDNSLMLVLYLEADDQFLQAIRGEATFTVDGNKMYLEDRVIVNDLTKVSYSVHPYKRIQPKLEWDEDLQEMVEVPQYMWELDLAVITASDLPTSQHIAKLVAIDPGALRPATVTRKFLGETYQVSCLVSQTAVELYQAGKLQVGDFVIVVFIDEIPDTQEYNLAIVVDKVWRSW